MAQGFLAGTIWGAVISVGGVAVLSLLQPLPQGPAAAVSAPEGAEMVPAPAAQTGVDPAGNDADLVERAPAAPSDPGIGADDLASLQAADTAPVAAPEVGTAGDDLAAPEAAAPARGARPEGEAPAPALPQSSTPDAPEDEAALSISTEPAQPRAPEAAEDGSAFAETPPEPAPEAVTSPDPAAPEGTVEVSPSAEADAPEAPAAPEIAALPQAGADPDDSGPAIGTPVAPLTERQSALVRRLPTVGAETDEAAQGDGPAPVAIDGPPLSAFAVPFEREEGKPLMSIVLIDGATSFGAEALEDFPYPLAFAIDPTLPDAAERMAARRAAGFEVVALIDLPEAATAQDAEVALSASFATLPEAVAVLEGTGTGIQSNRELSNQVTEIAGGTGRGLITQDSGLNTVQKLAQREGVPSAVVFRDFDGAGQTPTVMRRFLDQAAFRAGQDGAVVMLGRVRPDTISALLLWGLQDRAARVSLAPVSAILRDSVPAE